MGLRNDLREKLELAQNKAWAYGFSASNKARSAAQAVAEMLRSAVEDDSPAIAQNIVDNADTTGIVPIGGIIPWHKDLSGVPALPSNFLELNGQTVNDADSPLDGVTLPNWNGDGRFLRGSGTSGTEQAADPGNHDHTVNSHSHSVPDHFHDIPIGFDDSNTIYYQGDNPQFGSKIRNSVTAHQNSIPDAVTTDIRIAETSTNRNDTTGNASPGTGSAQNESGDPRPINASVVMVMRIK